MARMFVACVDQSGKVYRSEPSLDRRAVEKVAKEAGGWVEAVGDRLHRTRRRAEVRSLHRRLADRW